MCSIQHPQRCRGRGSRFGRGGMQPQRAPRDFPRKTADRGTRWWRDAVSIGQSGPGLAEGGNLSVILFANTASLFLFDQLRQSPCLSCRSIATGKPLRSSKSPGALGKGPRAADREEIRTFRIREWWPVAMAGEPWWAGEGSKSWCCDIMKGFESRQISPALGGGGEIPRNARVGV